LKCRASAGVERYHARLKGVTRIGRDLLVVSNDDDFGVVDGGASSFVSKTLPSRRVA